MFPESILHTNQLILRPFDASDIPDTHASCADALTQRWLPLPKPYTLDDCHQLVHNHCPRPARQR